MFVMFLTEKASRSFILYKQPQHQICAAVYLFPESEFSANKK